MQTLVWRIQNNGTPGSAGSGPIGDLPAQGWIDINADQVSVRWGGNTPYSTNGISAMYIQNQTIGIQSVSSAAAVASIGIGNSGADNVAIADLVELETGKTLYHQQA